MYWGINCSHLWAFEFSNNDPGFSWCLNRASKLSINALLWKGTSIICHFLDIIWDVWTFKGLKTSLNSQLLSQRKAVWMLFIVYLFCYSLDVVHSNKVLNGLHSFFKKTTHSIKTHTYTHTPESTPEAKQRPRNSHNIQMTATDIKVARKGLFKDLVAFWDVLYLFWAYGRKSLVASLLWNAVLEELCSSHSFHWHSTNKRWFCKWSWFNFFPLKAWFLRLIRFPTVLLGKVL